jgi:hypothetical protein
MGRIAAMQCICCELLSMEQETPTSVHHIREGRIARCDFLTLPLCWGCHQGPRGVHGSKGWLTQLAMSEVDLLGAVIERMAKETA